MGGKSHDPIIIITGPTASGKTALALELAEKLSGEIINADVGQLFTPCSVGTAKPAWRSKKIPHHLFDIIDEPQDLSAATYRDRVLEKIAEIQKRGNRPLIVGGSLFYLKSLFFPPQQNEPAEVPSSQDDVSWDALQAIDPKRAETIHPHDTYRIQRALDVWKKTGEKPSTQQPRFDPAFRAHIITILPPRDVLFERINNRTCTMLAQDGGPWADECEKLRGTHWEPFLHKKKLIGYPEIFSWLEAGRQRDDHEKLVSTIQTATRRYAKRQITFWRMFKKEITLLQEAATPWISFEEITTTTASISLPQGRRGLGERPWSRTKFLGIVFGCALWLVLMGAVLAHIFVLRRKSANLLANVEKNYFSDTMHFAQLAAWHQRNMLPRHTVSEGEK